MKCLHSHDHYCYCHYDIINGVNVYTCSSIKLNMMPMSVPNFTNWVILQNSSINSVDGFRSYLLEVQFLHLGDNALSYINYSFLFYLQSSKTLTWLNLTSNKLTGMPFKIQKVTYFERIWLSHNPFHCDCSMLWMIGWLNNFTNSRGKHVVVDYQDVRCNSGTAHGMPIYKLNAVLLGCYPKGLILWQKILIGTGSGTAGLIIVLLLILSIKRSRSLQFFIFYRLKIKSILSINNDLEDENIEDKEYDAFLSYR